MKVNEHVVERVIRTILGTSKKWRSSVLIALRFVALM